MNIYTQELKMNMRSVITWSVAVFLIVAVVMSIYPAFAQDADLMTNMLDQFPPQLLMAFGMTDMDMGSPLGFFAFLFMFCQIFLGLQAANYGISLVSVEERELTADFLLAKPVSRVKILTKKFLAALTSMAVTEVVLWIASFVFINAFKGDKAVDSKALIVLLLSVAVFQLVFLTVGVLLSMLVRRVRTVTPFSMALVFGTYVLSTFGSMLGEDTLEIISPFRHFDPNYIVSNAAFEMPLALLSVAFIAISVVGSYWLYQRRDIHSAV